MRHPKHVGAVLPDRRCSKYKRLSKSFCFISYILKARVSRKNTGFFIEMTVTSIRDCLLLRLSIPNTSIFKKNTQTCKFPYKMFPLIDEGQNKAHYQGSMAELAYAAVSKTAAGNGVRVRSPLLLPSQAMPAQITMEGAICHVVYPLAICTCWLRQCHLCQSH